jgi:hypothetical protein
MRVPEVSLVSIRRRIPPIIVGAILVTLLSPLTANAQATAAGVDCGLPESDADALVMVASQERCKRLGTQAPA